MITEYQLLCNLILLTKTDSKNTIKGINIINNYMLSYNNFRAYVDNNHINIINNNIINVIELVKKLDKKYKSKILYILEKIRNIALQNNRNKVVVESCEEIDNLNKFCILNLLANNNIEIEANKIEYVIKKNETNLDQIITIKVGNFALKLSFINFIMQNIQEKKSTNFWQFVYEQ